FQGFQTTDAMGALANARAKDENSRLQMLAKQGLTPEQFAQQGIAAGAEKRAIKDLEDQAFLSPTAAGARSFTRQIPVLKEIFEVKKQILAGTITEEEGVEKILVLEKKRLQVNDSLGKKLEDAFVFTDAEIQNELNTKLVDGAKQFAKTISDGLVDAIVKGEDLGDTLRNAATQFFTGMAKDNMDAAFKRITSAFGSMGG
ncbi:MAG: hypothetical protein GY915_09500, partial [bacterium]|nr:hypothetical protein [bacterium]